MKSDLPAGRVRSHTKQFRRAFYVLSGQKAGQIFYNRTALKNGTFSAVELTYPAEKSGLWNPISALVSKCFKPG